MSSPSRTIEPASTRTSPAIAFNSVLLPAPLPPITTAKSPGSSATLTLSSAMRSPGVPAWNVLRSACAASIALLDHALAVGEGCRQRPAHRLQALAADQRRVVGGG